jgi:hypothetical protein
MISTEMRCATELTPLRWSNVKTMIACNLLKIGAEGGSRTHTTTDFKPVSVVPTSFYYALPSRIYRRFSRQSKLRLAWYEHISPSSSPHPLPFPVFLEVKILDF